VQRLKTDPRLLAAELRLNELPASGDVIGRVKAFAPGQLTLALISLDELRKLGIVGESIVVTGLTQPAQHPETSGLFGLQDSVFGLAVMAEVGRGKTLVPIGFWSRGQTAIVSKTLIREASDFRGRRIRSAFTSEAAAQPVAALGADTVDIAGADALMALRAGMFDTAEFGPALASAAVEELDGGSLATRYRPLIGFVISGATAWEALSEAQKATLADAVKAADAGARVAALQVETRLEARARERQLAVVNLAQTGGSSFQPLSQKLVAERHGEPGQQAFAQMSVAYNEIVASAQIPRPPSSDLGEIGRMLTAGVRNASETFQPTGRITNGNVGAVVRRPTPVIFVTDRHDQGSADPGLRFASTIVTVPKLTCGQVGYTVAPDRTIGSGFDGRIVLEPQALPVGPESCISFVVDALRTAGKSRVLLFIHGFNNTFDAAIRRAIGSAADIDFDGVVLVWSWPSEGRALSYWRDEDVWRRSSDYVSEFIQARCSRSRR
jgi:hypothetical protein